MASGSGGSGQRPKDDRLLPHQIRRQGLTVQKATERTALTKGATFRAFAGFVKTRHVVLGFLSCVSNLQV